MPENNEARVVVHARHASVGIDGKFLNPDPMTGWGLWSDEYFTVSPDGVAVRHVVAKNHNGGGYDKNQRAYVFTAKAPGASALEFSLEATPDSPFQNPAFVVKNWGNRPAKLLIDGKAIPRGKDFRFGLNKTLEGTDLVAWVKTKGDKKTSFKIQSPSAHDDDQDYNSLQPT